MRVMHPLNGLVTCFDIDSQAEIGLEHQRSTIFGGVSDAKAGFALEMRWQLKCCDVAHVR